MQWRYADRRPDRSHFIPQVLFSRLHHMPSFWRRLVFAGLYKA